MTERRVYPIQVHINGQPFQWVMIDPHYELKHAESISDGLILELVKALDGQRFRPEDTDSNGYEYFVLDGLMLRGKAYRLVWVIPPDSTYIGVVNAFRRSRGRTSES